MKKINAEVKRITIKSEKKFLAGINSSTPRDVEMWSRVLRLKKNKMRNVTLLNCKKNVINKSEEIANVFGQKHFKCF